jgi:hypothetical protein
VYTGMDGNTGNLAQGLFTIHTNGKIQLEISLDELAESSCRLRFSAARASDCCAVQTSGFSLILVIPLFYKMERIGETVETAVTGGIGL